MLRDEAFDQYRHQGWVKLSSGLPPEVLAELRAELTALCRGARGPIPGASVVAAADDDAAVLGRHVALHFPHKRSARVRALVHEPWVAGVFSRVLGPHVKVVQTMFFIRPPGGPGQAWHQDARYIPAPPGQLVGLWLALEPATVESGCLWVLPGSHHHGALHPHGPHGDARFDLVHGVELEENADAHAVVCAAGDVVLFDGHLLHRSLPNRSAGFRRSLALHAVPAGLRMPWMGAESTARGDCRDFELICGEDPHHTEPMEDRLLPWLRPARL